MLKLSRLGGKPFFSNEANDIAVSLASITSVSKERSPIPKAIEVDCHHMNYFTEPESRRLINDLLRTEIEV